MSISICAIDNMGAFSDVPVLEVTDGSAVSHTISSGKQGLLLMNVGDDLCWMGGSTVDADNERGIIMLPRMYFLFRSAKSSLKVYFQCATGGSTKIGITEYS